MAELTVAWEAAPSAQLSLQLRRDQTEAAPPADISTPKVFARYDRSIGDFGIVAGYFDRPADLAVNRDETIFVLDTGNNRVQTFNQYGEYQSQFGEKGAREGQFESPQAVAVSANGFIYIVDTNNNRIQQFRSTGEFVLQIPPMESNRTPSGSRTGQFNKPRDVAFDNEGFMYVADPENDRIQKFTANGVFIEEWNKFSFNKKNEAASYNSIISLAYDNDRFGYLLALSDKEKMVQRFELDGDLRDAFPVKPEGDCLPVRIEVDNDNGLIFIVDRVGNRVLRYSKDGAYQGEIAAGDGAFSAPEGLCVDVPHKRLYVADTGNNKIQRFYMR